MPPAGPQRRRLFLLLSLLGVAFVVLYYQWSGGTPAAAPGPQKTNPVDAILNQTTPAKAPIKPGAAPNAQVPEALKLAQLDEKVPEEPEAGRNLFRFGVPPPPPPPPTPVYKPPPPPVDTGPPPPPPVPPILLKYTSYLQVPSGPPRAYLVDPTGKIFEAVEGQEFDGRYKLHKVTPKFVEISWLDGSGRKTIPLSG